MASDAIAAVKNGGLEIMLEPIELESVNCGVCGSDRSTPYASGKDYEYRTSDEIFHIVKCQECGNLYLNPRPIQQELDRIYPPSYYSYNYDKAVHPLALRAKQWLDDRKLKSWFSHLKMEKPTFLDVGCGNGRYLELLYRRGIPKYKLYGIETNLETVDRLNSKGYQTYCGNITDIEPELPPESFDLIVMLQVIEHLDDPRSSLQSLSRLLRPGGILVLETPNSNSADVKLFRQGFWGGYHFPRHWNLFDRPLLERLLTEANLEVKSFRFLPSPAFWILSCQHAIANGWRWKKIARSFDPLQNIPLLSLFTSFDILRSRLGFQTSNIQAIAIKPE